MTSLSSGDSRPAARPTLRDVAALAGVSIKTASRVVNAEGGVSPAVVERVTLAVDQLGYRQDFAASALRRSGRKTQSVGLIVDDVGNPYSAALHRSIEQIAMPRGVVVLGASSNQDPQRERDLVATFTARRVDGLIIVPASPDHGYLASERRAGTAVVFVDRPSRNLDADAIVTADFDGARSAVGHLAQLGHTRIAVIADVATVSTAQLRVDGFRAELEHRGIRTIDEYIRMGVYNSDMADVVTQQLMGLEAPPTAIFAAQNLITFGVIHALRRFDLHRTVAVVGFDDFLLADLLDPAVTVVAQDMDAIGKAAAELLFRRIDGEVSAPTTVIVPTRLIPRGSGEILPGLRAAS